MAASRMGRPLVMIDLAVPRDIEPSVRDCPGIALYDMDDLQSEVARNLSGRQSEADEALVLVREEVGRFETWLDSLDVVPTISALRRRGDEIVEQVLRENESRWESLSEADRERLATMASAVVSRLLHEPTRRLRGAAGEGTSYRYVHALHELFGLEAALAPARGGARRGRPARRTPPAPRPVIRLGTRGSALALAQAKWVAERLPGEVELVPITTSGDTDGTRAIRYDRSRPDPRSTDKARFVKELEDALLADEIDVAVHSAKDVPTDFPSGLLLLPVPGRADPRDAICGAESLDDLPEGAVVGTASLRRRAAAAAAAAGPRRT